MLNTGSKFVGLEILVMEDALPVNREDILRLIYLTIDEINETLPEDRQLEKSVGTHLIGRGGKLDSLGLVNFIILLEQGLADEFRLAVTLADEKAVSRVNSPFRTVENLTDYVLEVLAGTE
jgi:acyl carrier protein